MTPDDARRQVTIGRVRNSRYTVTNARGDVDLLSSRRAEPDSFQIVVGGTKVRDHQRANRLTDIVVTFKIAFPDGEDGDKARAVLPDAVKVSHDRLCTVSRTIEIGTPITPVVE